MIDLTKKSKEVHQKAVAHGFWEEERSFDEVIALCHSELSEALEEYRAGRLMVWYGCGIIKCTCIEGRCNYYEDGSCGYKNHKPEGIAVEMIDCLLRILDYAGKCGWECNIESKEFAVADKFDFTSCIAELHSEFSVMWLFVNANRENECESLMMYCAGKIVTWLEANYGGNWLKLLELKHEYNKSRTYKHGGKKV